MAFEDEDGLQPVEGEPRIGPLLTIPIQAPDIVEEPEEFDDVKTSFDPQFREPFIGLLHLGYLSDTFTLFGHKFYITTPTQRERLESGVLHKEFGYVNSISNEVGWTTLTVALYLKEVDDEPLPEPLGPKETGVRDRFNWVIEHIRPEIIQRIFEYCLILDGQVAKTLAELEESAKA